MKKIFKVLSACALFASFTLMFVGCDTMSGGSSGLSAPEITVENGKGKATVTITCKTEGAEILYVDDCTVYGDSAKKYGEKYTEPITLYALNNENETYTIRAVATKDGSYSNEVTKEVIVKGVTMYTVTFKGKIGMVPLVIPGVQVAEGDCVVFPVIYEKLLSQNGYTFEGWYNGDEKFDIENTPITSDLTLTGKWVEKTESTNSYVVTFKSEGTTLSKQTVDEGNKVTKPSDPEKDGYTFDGWYNGETEFNFDSQITEDITLTAKWTENNVNVKKYTVIFEIDEGTSSSVTVKEGEKVTKPSDPKKDGYTFDSWYNGDTEFDFNSPITEDITLTATWIENNETIKEYTVTFYTDGTTSTVTVKEGEKVTKPSDPEKDDYTFIGWYNNGTEFDFNSPITDNITLTAMWLENGPVTEYDKVTIGENSYTIENPTMVNAWNASVLNNEVTFSGNSAVYWKSDKLMDYDTITLNIFSTSANNFSVKGGDITNGKYADVGYPTTVLNDTKTVTYNISEMNSKLIASGGTKLEAVVLSNNANDGDWTNGPAWDADWDMYIESIVLGKIEKKEDIVVFDPSTMLEAPDGMELIEVNGSKFLKVYPSEYNTFITIDSVDVTGYMYLKAEVYFDESSTAWKFDIGAGSPSYTKISDIDGLPLKGINIYKGSITDGVICTLQPMTQETTTYTALSDKPVCIGRIIATTSAD